MSGALLWLLCLLLLPVVQGFAWAANSRYDRLVLWAVVGYLVLTCVMLTGLLPALWWTPAVALGYLALSRAVRGCSEPVPGEPGRSAAPSPSAASPPDSGTA